VTEEITTCQICGRIIKSKRGLIAHHGYKRPDIGWQTASCMGARGLPYEVSCNLIPPAIERVSKQIENIENKIKDYMTNPPEKITTEWLGQKRDVVRPYGFNPEIKTHNEYMPKSYENAYRKNLWDMKRQLGANVEFKKYLEDRLVKWKAKTEAMQ